MAAEAINHEPAFSNQVRTINLALQGGGAHGAFTWGVLDRLLEEKYLGFEGLSATSAGAMNAAVFAYGLAVDGRDGARKALAGRRQAIS
jgi:NTE family protein